MFAVRNVIQPKHVLKLVTIVEKLRVLILTGLLQNTTIIVWHSYYLYIKIVYTFYNK
jgi:hypothetical protein